MVQVKIVLAILLLLCSTVSLRADDVATEPSEAEQKLLADYYAEIALRPAWDVTSLEDHTNAIRNILAGDNGNELLETSAGIFVWNSSIGNVELWRDNEQQSLSLCVDSVGRVAFAGTTLSGFVDTLNGEHLFFLLEVDGAASLWICEIVGVGNNISPISPIAVNPKKCLCKGSNDVCPNGRIACEVENSCTYTPPGGGPSVNSTCRWLRPPAA